MYLYYIIPNYRIVFFFVHSDWPLKVRIVFAILK